MKRRPPAGIARERETSADDTASWNVSAANFPSEIERLSACAITQRDHLFLGEPDLYWHRDITTAPMPSGADRCGKHRLLRATPRNAVRDPGAP